MQRSGVVLPSCNSLHSVSTFHYIDNRGTSATWNSVLILVTDVQLQDGPEYMLDLHNVDCSTVEQILRYLYTFENPDLEPYSVDQWEANRTKIWTDAIVLLSAAEKYELHSLGNEAYEVLLRHATRLCRRWDEFDVKRKTARLQLAADLWTRFPASDEMRPLKDSVLKGLVKVSDKIADNDELKEILETKVAFTVDYVKALSAKKGRKGAKVEPPTC